MSSVYGQATIVGNDYVTRTRLAAACCDSDFIPKVPGAGGVVRQGDVSCQVMHNGVLVKEDCYYGKWMTELIRLLRGHHEPQEERAFHQVLGALRPGSVMIEGGAYWSYYSLWLHKRLSSCRTILVEPDRRNLEVGRLNFSLNGSSGEFVNAYVGGADTDGSEKPDGVPTVSVDGLVERFGLDRVHLLHMDVQGAEAEMLRGGRRAFSERQVDFAFVSTHGDKMRHQPCLEILRGYGYEILCEHDMRDSFSYDGLIVARSPSAPRAPTITVTKRSHLAPACAGDPASG